jgi:hypothetical protein
MHPFVLDHIYEKLWPSPALILETPAPSPTATRGVVGPSDTLAIGKIAVARTRLPAPDAYRHPTPDARYAQCDTYVLFPNRFSCQRSCTTVTATAKPARRRPPGSRNCPLACDASPRRRHQRRHCYRRPCHWSRPGSNRQPPRCKRGALPIELRPRCFRERHRHLVRHARDRQPAQPQAVEWAREDSNLGPRPYQGRALTN